MKSALTRLPLLLVASLALCVWTGGGLALAAKHKHHPTNPARHQYVEVVPTINAPPSGSVPTISGRKRHTHKPSTTTTHHPTPSGHHAGTSKGTAHHRVTHHHRTTTKTTTRTTTRTTKKHHQSNATTTPHRTTRMRSGKQNRSGTGLTVAAATGSGGSLGVWLLVILILVLLTGSVVGIIRYRRTH